MIADRYLTRTPKSAALNEEAKRSMPGGDTRSTAWFRPYPPFVASWRRSASSSAAAPRSLHRTR